MRMVRYGLRGRILEYSDFDFTPEQLTYTVTPTAPDYVVIDGIRFEALDDVETDSSI